MAGDFWPTTSATLLGKLLHSADRETWNRAWKEFVDRYGPGVLSWCRRKGMQPNDAENVLQIVLEKLHQKMAFFASRRWLWAVVRQAARDLLDVRNVSPGSELARVRDALVGLPVDRDLLNALDPGDFMGVALPLLRGGSADDDLLRAIDPGGFMRALLSGAAPRGAAAENAFHEFLRPALARCCVRWKLENQEALITEKLLAYLTHAVRSLPRDALSRFRAWLHVVVRNAAIDALKELGRGVPTLGVVEDTEQDQEDFVAELIRREIRQEAEDRVRRGLKKSVHWDAYQLIVHENLSGKEVASRTGLEVGTIYVTLNRLKKKVQEEILRLEAEPLDDVETP